ncbi:haloacid dehalogenase superfamily, subfamily IA, variant 3 with third motif having DD or ED [Prevotellaceae bacterium HUN156]|nr:haloacid dehalogenase superfamily, subfamily IA, variant 3 with third motif having DD or ED [Prevotellaceae bacterium HUN156]
MNKAIQQYLERHGFGHLSPKAVLFDMDGVIYNSMPNHAKAWNEAMNSYGLNMPFSMAYEYEGMRGIETIKVITRQQWKREVSDEEATKMYQHKSRLFATHCQETPATIMPGVKSLMQQIKAQGMKICVVTGSGQHTLLNKLQNDFDGMVCKDLMVTAFDVKHGKPNPEPYIIGMQKCGVEPWETIVIENAPLGVRAAHAAHCFTIAVNTGPLPAAMLIKEGADLVYSKMEMLSDDWQKLMDV